MQKDLPYVHKAYQPLRKQLWEGYVEIKDTEWMKKTEPLDEAFVPILERHFQAFLEEVARAASGTFPGYYEPNEAEGRQNWDNLMKLFFTEGDEIVSPYVL